MISAAICWNCVSDSASVSALPSYIQLYKCNNETLAVSRDRI